MSVGIRRLDDLSWKQLMELDACTKCGRCHEACPARGAGLPLSPRDLVLDMRELSGSEGGRRLPVDPRAASPLDGARGDGGILPGGVIAAETLWSCTTCLACVELCPVGIEHVPLIVGMRRALVDDGAVDKRLQDVLAKLAQHGNSFGVAARQRGRWAKELPFPVKDARKEATDHLWFVGDYASFDARVAQATRAAATVLHRAGVDFGILYDAERNSGNDVRRLGEEGLFQMLVEQNTAALAGAQFRAIVTTDPHSLNALRHEYPGLVERTPVVHLTELLARLLRDGRLRVTAPLGATVTYHDPCYLARYARVVEEPRDVLRRIGANLVEMPRHGMKTHCCGAGGGRIWMDDRAARKRPSEERIEEALGLPGVTTFAVACPKDVNMFEAAVVAVGASDRLRVRDVAELVEEATRPL